MVSFEIFVKSMLPSLSELKVTTSFCFAFKIPDDMTASSKYTENPMSIIGLNEENIELSHINLAILEATHQGHQGCRI